MIFWGAAFQIGRSEKGVCWIPIQDYSKTKFQAERVKELELE